MKKWKLPSLLAGQENEEEKTMSKSEIQPKHRLRGKFWWLCPTLTVKADAVDAAWLGIAACAIISGMTVFTALNNYYYGDNAYSADSAM